MLPLQTPTIYLLYTFLSRTYYYYLSPNQYKKPYPSAPVEASATSLVSSCVLGVCLYFSLRALRIGRHLDDVLYHLSTATRWYEAKACSKEIYRHINPNTQKKLQKCLKAFHEFFDAFGLHLHRNLIYNHACR